MKKILIKLVALLLITAPLLTANAGTYKWVDSNGDTVYSEHPPESGPYERLDAPKSPSYGTEPDYGSDETATTGQSATDAIQQGAKTQEERARLDAEVAKNEALRKENCDAARKNLEIYTVFRRIKQEDGTVIRLNDVEREQKKQEAEAAIKEFCY